MRILFVAPASVFKCGEEEDGPVSDEKILSSLDNIRCEDESMVDHMADDQSVVDIWKSTKLSGGILAFKYLADTNKLAALTEYVSDRDLSDAEVNLLRDYTHVHWIDGIGSYFAQTYSEEAGLIPQVDWVGDGVIVLVDDEIDEL